VKPNIKDQSFYRKLHNASISSNQELEANRDLQNFTIVRGMGGVKDQEFGRGSLSPDRSPAGR